MNNWKDFFDLDFKKNLVAGIVSGLIVGGLISKTTINYLKETAIPGAVKIGGELIKSSVATASDGTTFSRYTDPKGKQYIIIEEKNGKRTAIFQGPYL